MKFLQHVVGSLFDADQGWVAKAVTAVCFLLVLVFIYFGLFGSFGVGASYNEIAVHARAAGFWWKVLGTILLAITIRWDYLNFSDRIKFQVDPMVFGISVVFSLALIICVNCGFRF